MRRSGNLASRVVLVLLTAWALLLVAPDIIRVGAPLSAIGLTANNDGLIYDVRGPFAALEDSPAWRAGVRPGDRLDFLAMRCLPLTAQDCRDLLAVVGGMGGPQLVAPGRVIRLSIMSGTDGISRILDLAAAPTKTSWLDRGMLLVNELIAVAFILAAAWLVWTRAGGMTWGFFLYAIWFNSGQDFVAFIFLQRHPRLLLAQEAFGTVMQGLAYAGFLLFVARVPADRTPPAWQGLERLLPLVALVFVVLQGLSYGSAFGLPSELAARATFLAGFAVDAAAIAILLRRSHGQPPREYQRLRWVIWGCVIGLPAFLLAAILQSTTLWQATTGLGTAPPELVAGLYALHGLLAWFVFEAVRRPRVVSVSIPLRRITVFGLMLSLPALLLHQQIEHLGEWLHLPAWGYLVMATLLLFLIGRAHEFGTVLADRVFNRAFRRQVIALRDVGNEIFRAESLEVVDSLLTEAPSRALGLASAAIFHRTATGFRRHGEAPGWGEGTARQLPAYDWALRGIPVGEPFSIEADEAARLGLPAGLAAPTVGVPVGDRMGYQAVALYGPHTTGVDLSLDERAMLSRLAADAALAYRCVETEALRRQMAALQAANATAAV